MVYLNLSNKNIPVEVTNLLQLGEGLSVLMSRNKNVSLSLLKT